MNETNEPSTPSLPYAKGSETSKAAAKSMEKIAPSDEMRVHAFFMKRGDLGATDKEIEEALAMSHESASARRNALMLKGVVKDSGSTRLTPSKRKATVWVLGSGAAASRAANGGNVGARDKARLLLLRRDAALRRDQRA